jgi:Cof subfamily protein (haloacid dehalogenase superfamily)
MIVTDLDGTLLNDNKKVSKKDFETLVALQKKEVVRVVATGRSLYSCKQVLGTNFPIDYLIFSSGAGILDFATGELLFTSHLNEEEISSVVSLFVDNQIDFSIQLEIPHNHKFLYYRVNNFNPDFECRCTIYKNFCNTLDLTKLPNKATQIIGIVFQGYEKFEKLKSKIKFLKLIRTTSPLDNKTIWIEVFPRNVSKSQGIDFLKDRIGVSKNEVVTIGNDYNDLDMLNYTDKRFVVASAPKDLKEKFEFTVGTNNQSAFSEVVYRYI